MMFVLVKEVDSFSVRLKQKGNETKKCLSWLCPVVTPLVSESFFFGATVKSNDTTNARHPPPEAAFSRRAEAFCKNMMFVWCRLL